MDYFRGVRPWPQLLRLSDRLPPFSRYKLAIADDDDLQRYRERHFNGKPPPSRPPSLSDWTVDDEMMNILHDGFSMLRSTMIALETPKGRQAPKFKPARRPTSAVDRAESRRDMDMHNDIVRRVLPHKYE